MMYACARCGGWLLALIALLSFEALANPPRLLNTPAEFDALRADLASGADTHIARVYASAKTHADANPPGTPWAWTPAPVCEPTEGTYCDYRSALTDAERAVAWAIAYQGTRDETYADGVRDYVMFYRDSSNITPLPPQSETWRTGFVLALDMTRESNAYSAGDLTAIYSSIDSWASDHIATAGNFQATEVFRNMTGWHLGVGTLIAVLRDDATLIAQARGVYESYFLADMGAQFGGVATPVPAGAMPDWHPEPDGRGADGKDYQLFTVSPVWNAVRAAENNGHDFLSVTNTRGDTIVETVSWVLDAASVKPPGAPQGMPTIYGQAPAPQTPRGGEYAESLPEATTLDGRHILPLVISLAPTNDALAAWFTGDHFERWQHDGAVAPSLPPSMAPSDDLFDRHGTMWLRHFLLAGSAAITGPPPPPPEPECNDTIDNDGDGQIDFPADLDCDDPQDDDESSPPPPGSAVVDRTITSPTSPETACTDTGELSLTGQSLTITATITPTAPLTNDNRVLIQGETWHSTDIYVYLAVDTLETKLRLKVGGLTHELSVPRGYSVGETADIVATYDGAELRLDAAGVVGALPVTGDITPGGTVLCEVGTQPNDAQYPIAPFQGQIAVQVTN